MIVVLACRHDDESDTASTDVECGWGGLGMFEYGPKGLPHALVHAAELVQTYGHHGACCTCVGEVCHKTDIKGAAKFARTYGDRNLTHEGMLEYVQRQELWNAVEKLCSEESTDSSMSSADESGDAVANGTHQLREGSSTLYKLREPLPNLTHNWSSMCPVDGRPPRTWGSTFLSERVLITRNELITLLRTKLQMQDTWENVTWLATRVEWECFGTALLVGDGGHHRKIVGLSNVCKNRRDFVRLRGTELDPVRRVPNALSAQVGIPTYT